MDYDMLIKGGTVATDTETFRADVGVRNGRIAKIGALGADATEDIDATGRYVLPGGIDSHVHIAQPSGEGIVMAEDFESGTRSALFGGNTTILPFCLQQRGQSIRQAIEWYHGLAEANCYTDVSFHLIISDPTSQVLDQELPATVKDGYSSFKVFMTYDDLRLNDAELEESRGDGAYLFPK